MSQSDNYETPNHILDIALSYVPKDKHIWEPFYCTGHSGEYIKQQGYTVTHNNNNFFVDCGVFGDMLGLGITPIYRLGISLRFQ